MSETQGLALVDVANEIIGLVEKLTSGFTDCVGETRAHAVWFAVKLVADAGVVKARCAADAAGQGEEVAALVESVEAYSGAITRELADVLA